jgi:hypothetical protein
LIIVNFWIPSLRLLKRFSKDIALKGFRYHPCILWMGVSLKIGMLIYILLMFSYEKWLASASS